MTAAIDCGRDPVGAAMWLARAFTAGRRLCVSAPGAPDHAHHVAVEFVHPVVAGTRSLAAVAAPDGDAASPADARLVIGEAGAASALAADLFIPPDQPDRAVVLSYHLLWELVQVALEHPGLVGSAAAAGAATRPGSCTRSSTRPRTTRPRCATSLRASAVAKRPGVRQAGTSSRWSPTGPRWTQAATADRACGRELAGGC